MNTPLLKYVAHLVELHYELHYLDKVGLNESEEAEEIRDYMDLPYSQLSEEQIELVNKLSASLNEERG